MRTVSEWREILARESSPLNAATRVIADLIGYRKTSLSRAEDTDNLMNALMAIRPDPAPSSSKKQNGLEWHRVGLNTSVAFVPNGLLFREQIDSFSEGVASAVALQFVPCSPDDCHAFLAGNSYKSA